MKLFTSKRERRLWLLTLAVVVAIYSTIGIAAPLAGILREYGLTTPAFVVGSLLAAAAVLTQRVRTRPGWGEVGIWVGIIAVYLLLFVRIEIPEERSHLIEYSVLGAFMYEALAERSGHRRRWRPAIIAATATALLGLLDEVLQGLFPGRFYDLEDVGFNAGAGLLAVAASVALEWARARRNR